LARSTGPSEVTSTAPSVAGVTDEDSKSLKSFQSESYVHASQTVGGDNGSGTGSADGGDGAAEKKPKKSKAQLWNEMKISCMWID
jgi:peroxin-3